MSIENKENFCTIYIVRHGETEWNAKHITQGQLNSSLTPAGIRQAKDTAEELRGVYFDAIFSSDLTRTQETAEIIKLDREILIQTSKLLRERNYGRFQGKHRDEYHKFIQEKLIERDKLSEEEQWNFRVAEDVETDESLVTRFINQLREIAVAYPNKTVLVVSHGGPIRMFLVKTGYMDKKSMSVAGTFENAGYIKVLSDGVDFFIKKVKGIKKEINKSD